MEIKKHYNIPYNTIYKSYREGNINELYNVNNKNNTFI